MQPTRRDMLKIAGAAAGVYTGLAFGTPMVWGADAPSSTQPLREGDVRKGDMIYRKLGRTGETVSIVGVGGFHMGVPSEEEGIRIVRTAIDHGVNFLDNSWDYHNGGSEERMGRALKDGYRAKVFLMTKLNGRTKKKAAEELDESLRRFGVDHLDLIQHHAIGPGDDPEKILAEDGAHAALVDAQKAGKARFIGFTGHKDPAAHMKMLETAKKHGVHFDTVQMPLNVMDAHFKSFEKTVLPELVKQQIGVLGMKPLGMGSILQSGVVKPIECLHYAMNLPTSVVITGMDKMQAVEQALEAVKTFAPMNEQQVAALLEKTKDAAKEGKFEPFKVSENYHQKPREWIT